MFVWEEGEGAGEVRGRDYKLAYRKLRVTDMFISLSVDMVSLVYTYFKKHQSVEFMSSLLYVNYI